MFVERIILSGFRCFGPELTTSIDLAQTLTAFVGTNGTGKTAVMQALQRLFGISGEQRRVRRQDFHIAPNEQAPLRQRTFVVEAILAFPEPDRDDGAQGAVPEFFHQMAADEEGRLKCRLRLQATWTDDGSLDGAIEQKNWAIRTFGEFEEADCIELKPIDRARIQMIYVPAARDAASQVTSFLRGRIWRAINWSEEVRTTFTEAGGTLNNVFNNEAAVDLVAAALSTRWNEVHNAGTDTTPRFRPIDMRFEEFIRKVEVVLHPDEGGRERTLDELSDGQRSLFHLAMTAATLDVEAQVIADPVAAGFQPDGVPLPALTMIAIEEPENNLAPFYLSRIVRQIEDLTGGTRAQAVVSSHSASVIGRVDPTRVRHFRLVLPSRTARVNPIRLPQGEEDASKFIREAVRTYPELYFARFVVLGEGASEEVVFPAIADATGLAIDPSFVAVVPLGGRHVNHLWRLLTDLDIPHATLLDLDWGRPGGGWGRIKTVCEQLLENGVAAEALFRDGVDPAGPAATVACFDLCPSEDQAGLLAWAVALRRFGVFFCQPLDLDYSMLTAFPDAYQVIEPGRQGPAERGDPRISVFGETGRGDLYGPEADELLRWYRYLFLGRGKPSTHVRVLSALRPADLSAGAPEELRSLLGSVVAQLEPAPPPPIG
jgi:putative ATP-dependent endonuclease of the OLD family